MASVSIREPDTVVIATQKALRDQEQDLRKAHDELQIKVAERTSEQRRSERELRDVIDTIPAIVWSTLPDGSNNYVNSRFTEYSGMSAEQMAGSGWQALIHPDDLERHAGKWMEAVATGKPYENEVRSRRGDGQYRWQLDRGVPLRDEDGNIVKWYGVTTDIEDRKCAEHERERLRQLEADLAHVNRVSTLGEMTASLAHEIKQPIAVAITSANSCIEWLAHEPPNLDRARAAAARIDKYGNRASEIIDHIRSLYKKSPPQRELVDMNGIILEMLTLAERRGPSIPDCHARRTGVWQRFATNLATSPQLFDPEEIIDPILFGDRSEIKELGHNDEHLSC